MAKDTQTIKEHVDTLKVKKPGFIYHLLGYPWKWMFLKKYNAHFHYEVSLKDIKPPYIVISNHTSRFDYMFVSTAFLPRKMNHVVGYNEFYRSHLKFIMNVMQCIPKRNFCPDFHAMKEMMRVIDNKGILMIYPEGMNSISGANQPVAIGTEKLIKHCKVPVLYAKIEGAYLENPKYCDEFRKGRVDITIGKLFDKEEVETKSLDEIRDLINKTLYHDAFKWNKEHQYHYTSKLGFATNMHHLLYHCPKCHHELEMKGEGEIIKCNNCGNGAIVSDTYDFIPLDKSCIIPSTQTEWWEMERELERERVKDENFELREKVKLGILPENEYLKNLETSIIVGAGEIVLNRNGLTYTGTKNGMPFSFNIASKDLPTYGMCTDMSRFYTFYQNEFYEFYPERESVGKWFLATEELHRYLGGKWQDFKEDVK